MRELEAEDFDVDRFIKDCKDLHAEAIVFSTGGPYAFYDTKVPYHVRSPHMGDRDLLREVVEKAKIANIRVIARLDFSIANQDVFNEREEWFFCDQMGIPVEKNAANGELFYRTRLLEGYRNEAVAFKVLHEVFSNYELDGVHLNSPGFQVKQFAEEDLEKHGIPNDPEKQKQWRKERLALQMDEYRSIIHSYCPNALFMAEINSPETPTWGEASGFDHELLAGSYTNLLSTAGEPTDDEIYKMRWWSALSADWSHASKSKQSGLPVTNLKIGYKKGKLSLKPIGDYKANCYQSFAHNAGVKAPSYGLLSNMPDPRAAYMISEPFQFMERCEDYMTGSERIANIALVWPGRNANGIQASAYRVEMLGLYRALAKNHALFEIILAHRLNHDLTKKYHTLIVPSAHIFLKEQIESLRTFVESGGHLILFDAFPGIPLTEEWLEFLGFEQGGASFNCAYAVSGSSGPSDQPEVIMLKIDLRQVIPPEGTEILYYNSPSTGLGNWVPEAFPVLKKGDIPVLFTMDNSPGRISYFAGSFGKMMWSNDLPDYRHILEKLVFNGLNQNRIIETDAPETVNITAYRTGDKTVIHLVNGNGTIPLDEPIPVGPIHISLAEKNASSARWFTPGKDTVELVMQPDRKHDALVVTIDSLCEYGILVLE